MKKMTEGPQARLTQISEALEILKHQMISIQITPKMTTGQGVLSFRQPSYFIIYFTNYYDSFLSLVLDNWKN